MTRVFSRQLEKKNAIRIKVGKLNAANLAKHKQKVRVQRIWQRNSNTSVVLADI